MSDAVLRQEYRLRASLGETPAVHPTGSDLGIIKVDAGAIASGQLSLLETSGRVSVFVRMVLDPEVADLLCAILALRACGLDAADIFIGHCVEETLHKKDFRRLGEILEEVIDDIGPKGCPH